MLTLYLVCFIVGGVLVAASAMLGGHEGADADHDLGSGADADNELGGADHELGDSADHEVGADTGHDLAQDAGDAPGHPAGDGLWLPFLSLRFWTFFAAFFGLTGLVLGALDLAPAGVTLAAATGVGFVSGTGVAWLYRALRRAQVDSSLAAEDLQGNTGRVLVPIEPGAEGLVRVRTRGMVKDLRAVSEDAQGIGRGEQVLVVRVRGGVARVTVLRAMPGDTAGARAGEGLATSVARRP